MSKKYQIIGRKVEGNGILQFQKDIPGPYIKEGATITVKGGAKLSQLGTCWLYAEGCMSFGDDDAYGWGGKCIWFVPGNASSRYFGDTYKTRICKNLAFASKLARFVRS